MTHIDLFETQKLLRKERRNSPEQLRRQLLAAVEVRVLEGERDDALQQAVGAVQGERVVFATHIDAGYVERDARADAGFALLRGGVSTIGSNSGAIIEVARRSSATCR